MFDGQSIGKCLVLRCLRSLYLLRIVEFIDRISFSTEVDCRKKFR
jgi:hypothetical protein